MENSILINKRVKMLAVYSDKDNNLPVCMPKRMLYGGKEYTFTELGLKHPTTKGKRMIHVFDMTDGQADYRLEFDAEGLTWTLMYILDASHAF
jgi:DNA-binding helix-hairpin-helix protein with protein kinase domain